MCIAACSARQIAPEQVGHAWAAVHVGAALRARGNQRLGTREVGRGAAAMQHWLSRAAGPRTRTSCGISLVRYEWTEAIISEPRIADASLSVCDRCVHPLLFPPGFQTLSVAAKPFKLCTKPCVSDSHSLKPLSPNLREQGQE